MNFQLKTGQRVMVYSEKKRKWMKGLVVTLVSDKIVWVNDGSMIIKLSRTHGMPQPDNVDLNRISELLRRLSIF